MDPRTGWNILHQDGEFIDVRIPVREWRLFQHLLQAPNSQFSSLFRPEMPSQLTWTSLADQFYQSFVRPRILRSNPVGNNSSSRQPSNRSEVRSESNSESLSNNSGSSSEPSRNISDSPPNRSELILHPHLECSICLESFEDQPVMNCSHFVCRGCLDHLRKDECPVCRRQLQGGLMTEEIRGGIQERRQQDGHDRRREYMDIDQRIAREQLEQEMAEEIQQMVTVLTAPRNNPLGDLVQRLFFS